IFSEASKRNFSFFASTSPNEIFYVPKSGGVRLDGDISNPIPNFAASTIVGTYPPFLNKPLTILGATMTTSMHLRDAATMSAEAKAAGFTVNPAPVAVSATEVTLKGVPSALTGRVETTCQDIPWTTQCTDDNTGLPITNPDGTPKMCPTTIPVCTMT